MGLPIVNGIYLFLNVFHHLFALIPPRAKDMGQPW